MRRPAHADEISGRHRGVARGVMRRAKNTPTDALTALESMRLLPILFAAALGPFGTAVGADCNDPAGCPVAGSAMTAGPGPAVAHATPIPSDVEVTALAPADQAAATARVAATLADGRTAGALVMRPETVRAGVRASAGDRGRVEQRSPGGSEPSSAWLMLLAGVAFAGFVITKRSRG
jgi:hypothetical protein